MPQIIPTPVTLPPQAHHDDASVLPPLLPVTDEDAPDRSGARDSDGPPSGWTLGAAGLARLTALRHDLHAHPELAFTEHRTAARISAWLRALGLTVHGGIGGTGLVATVHGRGRSASNPGPSIGLRADMDALPITETSSVPHTSRHPGKMHACGHDGHMAMLLGAAQLLVQDAASFDGSVHLIFQPAEEGDGGAESMIRDGLFTRFACQAVFALHNWPPLPQGQMAVRVGPIMAATMRFEIRVRGAGGHAAMPHRTVDPIPVACAIVSQLQTLVSRNVDPVDSAVLTIGRIEAGTAENIIPDEAAIYGTVRTLRPQTERLITEGIERIAHHIAAAHQCQASYSAYPGCPATVNTAPEAQLMARAMAACVGQTNSFPAIDPAMTAEDFGCMLQVVPGAYGWIGNGAAPSTKGGNLSSGLHNAGYDFHDDNIALGARFWHTLVRMWMQENSAARPIA